MVIGEDLKLGRSGLTGQRDHLEAESLPEVVELARKEAEILRE